MEEIDTKKGPPDEATIKDLAARAGSVAALINLRHATAKEKGWAENPPDVSTFAKAVAKDVNLLRRPLLLVGKKLIIGFDKPAYAKL